ncbi:MAG: hypothetical protein M3065_22845 [Actinomycetota bacterium]|nr:hypothetical protein [Actinomycetota bacterium]
MLLVIRTTAAIDSESVKSSAEARWCSRTTVSLLGLSMRYSRAQPIREYCCG